MSLVLPEAIPEREDINSAPHLTLVPRSAGLPRAAMIAQFLEDKLEERRLFCVAIQRPLVDGNPHPVLSCYKAAMPKFVIDLDAIAAEDRARVVMRPKAQHLRHRSRR